LVIWFHATCSHLHRYKVYGQNLFFHLRGEFAFVLYDAKRDLLIAARDRSAIKPLYYTVDSGRLLITSEMKALPAFGWKPEWDIDSIVNMGDFCDDRTVFKGVYKVRMTLSRKIVTYHTLSASSSPLLDVSPHWPTENPSLLGS
jgi:asparagine synthetase B (glutamine-hydrolysing)